MTDKQKQFSKDLEHALRSFITNYDHFPPYLKNNIPDMLNLAAQECFFKRVMDSKHTAIIRKAKENLNTTGCYYKEEGEE